MHDRLEMDSADRTIIDLPLEVKADGAPGTFEGYGAVFGNTDRDGDVVERGAFAASLKERMPALLWQHNAKEPIGRFDVVREDAKGLYVKGRLSMTGRGAEAYDLLKLGALNGLSIGFVTKEALRNRATGTRTIKRAELMEVSLVTFPANELARVSAVKQVKTAQTMKGNAVIRPVDDIETPRDFERLLRDAGFSRTRAKAITAKGFRGSAGLIEATPREQIELQQEILHDLEAKRSGLLSFLRSLGSRGPRGASLSSNASVSELADRIAGAYRAVRGTTMPIYLHTGETKKFKLPISTALRSNPRVTVQAPTGSFYDFNCTVNYWAWTRNGPERQFVDLSLTKSSRSLEIGTKADVEAWLRSEGGDSSDESALVRFERAVSRVNSILSSGLAPWGTIERKRFQSRVLINQEGTIGREVPFRITTTR